MPPNATVCSEGNIFLEIGTLVALTYYQTPSLGFYMMTEATRHGDRSEDRGGSRKV